jgi:proteasome assembly chaperone (PAC2) family protein
MGAQRLRISHNPDLREPKLVVGFSGWMDGGEVSTGSLAYLIRKLGASPAAEILPDGFYVYSLPGMMELAGLLRPQVRIREGLVEAFEFPQCTFFSDELHDLIMFSAREPHLQWEDFANCVFDVCREFGVKRIYSIGSVSSLVPHTREPRLFCTTSNASLKAQFQHYGVRFTDYEGPASIVTYLTSRCPDVGLEMVSLVAAIPAYVQGSNPKCIEAMTRRLTGMLQVDLDMDDLRTVSEEFERKVAELVQQQPELAKNIGRLEEDYDNEIFNSELGDLKDWLEQQGIRLD